MRGDRYYIYGAGGHAHVVIDALREQGVGVEAVFDDAPDEPHPGHAGVRAGIRVAGPEQFPVLTEPMILCVGRNAERAELARLVRATFAVARHPSAVVAPSVTIGEGTVVLHGAIVQTNSVIGRHVIVNTAASIDHETIIGDYAHISPRATLCGQIVVGEGSQIGAGAVVVPGVRIGRWSTVGAGAVVLHDVPDHVTVVGNPARIVPGAHGQDLPRAE